MLANKALPFLFFPTTWITITLLLATWSLWRSKLRAARISLTISLVVLLTFSSPPIANSLWQSLENIYPVQPINTLPPAEAIVLLGGGVELPAPPRVMPDLNESADRVWMAAELYHAGKAPLVVVSGGQVFEQPGLKSEADYHVLLLERMGVPRDAILTETHARNTRENATFVAKLLKQRKISHVLLTTSAMHMPRSMLLFEHTGLQVTPAPCDVRVAQLQRPWLLRMLPNAESLALAEGAIREWLGYGFYALSQRFMPAS